MTTLRMSLTYAIMTTAIVLALTTSPIVFAASPHFIGTPQIKSNPDLSLTATFKAAGLGNLPSGAFLTASDVSATQQCVNKGGNPPPPKHTEFGPVTGPTTQIPPSNGQITASASIGITLPSADCPNPNWKVDVTVVYSNVVLHIQQGGQDLLTFNFGTQTVHAIINVPRR